MHVRTIEDEGNNVFCDTQLDGGGGQRMVNEKLIICMWLSTLKSNERAESISSFRFKSYRRSYALFILLVFFFSLRVRIRSWGERHWNLNGQARNITIIWTIFDRKSAEISIFLKRISHQRSQKNQKIETNLNFPPFLLPTQLLNWHFHLNSFWHHQIINFPYVIFPFPKKNEKPIK